MRPWPGHAYPLGATYDGAGTNFALFSEVAERVELCLFAARGQGDPGHAARGRRVRLPRLPAHRRARASATATACTARTTRPRGLRCNPTKLLIDPYAKALDGPGRVGRGRVRLPVRRSGRAHTTPTPRAYVPKSVVVNPFFDWGTDRPPRIPYHETVIYEAHVRGLTDPATPRSPRRCAAPTRASRTR